jgi:hypothetical protein
MADGEIRLLGAHIGGQVALDGATLIRPRGRVLTADGITVDQKPQLYEQLATFYRRAGRDDDARKVAIAKQRRRRQALNRPGKVWNSLLRWTIGYGYRTWQAGLWLLGFLVVGWIVFARAYPTHMTPTKQLGQPMPHFHPLVYALDTLLPVVDLHQQDSWIPRGVAQWGRGRASWPAGC